MNYYTRVPIKSIGSEVIWENSFDLLIPIINSCFAYYDIGYIVVVVVVRPNGAYNIYSI